MARRHVTWDVWVTASDKLVCARCASLAGRLFRRGHGPRPPLHDECRCRRVLAFVQVVEDDEIAREEEAP